MKSKNILLLVVSLGLSGCVGPVVANRKGSGRMEIVSATYGANCGAPKGNVTAHLANTCNSTAKCEYRIDVNSIGDPSRGCAKTYEAEYRCSPRGTSQIVSVPAEANTNLVTLDCPSLFGRF